MSLEKQHPRNAGKPRCEHCSTPLRTSPPDCEVITCNPCAAALALDLAGGKPLPHWEAGRVGALQAEAAGLRLVSTRPAPQWRGIP